MSFGEGRNGTEAIPYRVFLYLRRTDGKEFEARSVQVDGAETALSPQAARTSQHGFLPLELPLPKAWEYGSFHHLAVTTADGHTAAAVVRGRDSFFSLGMWGYRNHGNSLEERTRDTCAAFRDFLFNTHMGMSGGQKKHLLSPEGLKMLDEMGLRFMADAPDKETARKPQLYARFLLDEPDAHEYAVNNLPADRRLGAYAQGIVQRQREWTEKDPRTLCLLNVDLTYKPENWLVYGQLPDIMALDPYYQSLLRDAYWRHPGRLAAFCHPLFVFAASEVARWASEPHPMHVILNSVSVREEARSFRYGTPEEKRIEFYYALAAGAKGISYWWFTPYGPHRGCGAIEPDAHKMMQELARLNAEARALEPLLALSCPAAISGSKTDPFVSALPVWLMARTLFVGTDTALIILVNRDHLSDRVGTLYQPIPKARVTFKPPPWLKPSAAFRLSSGNIEPVQFAPQGE
ncbi:MAG: hypothetical protein FJ278_21210, partial [Planctomycetes bacterium]|nr:hypothetical protein [Planctomycetota bacterium]